MSKKRKIDLLWAKVNDPSATDAERGEALSMIMRLEKGGETRSDAPSFAEPEVRLEGEDRRTAVFVRCQYKPYQGMVYSLSFDSHRTATIESFKFVDTTDEWGWNDDTAAVLHSYPDVRRDAVRQKHVGPLIYCMSCHRHEAAVICPNCGGLSCFEEWGNDKWRCPHCKNCTYDPKVDFEEMNDIVPRTKALPRYWPSTQKDEVVVSKRSFKVRKTG